MNTVVHSLCSSLDHPDRQTLVTQGGDLGYIITRLMAQKYPQHVRAHHTNTAGPNEPTADSNPSLYAETQAHTLTEREKSDMARLSHFRQYGIGYFAIQSTKPQTISAALTDSPAGLLTWIYDALYTWSDHENCPWSDDDVITWISIYYFSTGGVAASVRIYYEEAVYGGENPFARLGEAGAYTDVPIGIASFPYHFGDHPRLWNKGLGPVVHQSEWEKGGHFAAFENPTDLVADLRAMFGKGGGAAGVLGVISGYEE